MKPKTALITGITGQDGSYLAEFLIEKGYEVHGIIRRSSTFNTGRIEHLYLDEWVRDMQKKRLVTLHYGDMTDSSSLIRIIGLVKPDEIYNLAAQSHVKVSFDVPEYTADTDAIGVLRLLEAVRILGMEKTTRIYQASTSELYGKVEEVPQNENTPFHPRSPYSVAKLYAYWIMKNYRESYGMYTANGILFNHESERRGENFVTVFNAVNQSDPYPPAKLYTYSCVLCGSIFSPPGVLPPHPAAVKQTADARAAQITSFFSFMISSSSILYFHSVYTKQISSFDALSYVGALSSDVLFFDPCRRAVTVRNSLHCLRAQFRLSFIVIKSVFLLLYVV